MKSARETASFISRVKLSRFFEAFGARPSTESSSQAVSTYWRNFSSAPGAGSVATTSNPCARYNAAQLPPMRPVPTIAIRFIGLFNGKMFSPYKDELPFVLLHGACHWLHL